MSPAANGCDFAPKCELVFLPTRPMIENTHKENRVQILLGRWSDCKAKIRRLGRKGRFSGDLAEDSEAGGEIPVEFVKKPVKKGKKSVNWLHKWLGLGNFGSIPAKKKHSKRGNPLRKILNFFLCSRKKNEESNHLKNWDLVEPSANHYLHNHHHHHHHRGKKTRAPHYDDDSHTAHTSKLAPSLAGLLFVAYLIEHRDRLRRAVWLAKRLHVWGLVQVKLRVILGLYAVCQILQVMLRRRRQRNGQDGNKWSD